MTTIKNKQTTLLGPTELVMNYGDLLAVVLNQPVREGITLKEMRADLDLLSKIETLQKQEEETFTKEEIDKIKALVSDFKWGARHTDLLDFGDYIDSL